MKNDLAKTIRETRINYKSAQRKLSKIELDIKFRNHRECARESQPVKDKISSLQIDLDEYIRQYRIRHIIACMLRGKSISQIEPKTKQDNDSIKKRNKIYSDVKWHLDMCGKKWIE